MATQVKYKFGDDEFNLKDYIHNLETNYQSYIASKNWNEGQQQEFKNSFDKYLTGLKDQLSNNTGRFYTDYSGAIFDNKGELSSTDDDNIDPVGSEYYYDNKGNRITTDDFNLLKKRKQKKYNTFSANREVATYLNTIGNALKGMETPKEKAQNAFDLSKHGFEAEWTKIANPAGGNLDYTPYAEGEEVDENGYKKTTKRASYLKEQLDNYIANLQDYDFSNSPFKDRESYLDKLRAASENLANGYNYEDTIALTQAGLSSTFLNNFFSSGKEKEKEKTELEKAAGQAAIEIKQREEDAKNQEIIDYNERKKKELEMSNYFNSYIQENPFQRTIDNTVIPTYNYDKTAKWIIANHPNINTEDPEQRKQIMNNFVNFPELASYIRGKLKGRDPDTKKDMTLQHIARNLDLAYQEGLFNDPRYLIKGENGSLKSILGDSGFVVIPDSENYSNYSFVGYNPVTRQYKEFSMINNDDLPETINKMLREKMAYNAYDKNIQKKEKGGILKFQIGGQGALRHMEQYKKDREVKEARDKKVQENAVKNDRTIEEQEKYENDSKLQWSDADKLRLGAIAGDVASLIASMTGVGSVASAAIGAASTAANQAADMKEGMGFWESLGNNAVSYGLDALSVLPFAKAAKIPRMVKTIAGFTPQLMAGISAVQGLVNGDEILESLKKVKNGESLTVGDWKNISQGLQIVLGGGAAFNRARVANKRLDAARTDSEYVQTNQGTVKLSADKMKKLRNATSLKQQNEILKDSGVTLKGKQTGKFWNRKTSDEAVDIPENFVYDLSKPVTLHSGDLQYQYKFGPGEKLLGGVNLDINFPRVRNAYNKVFHPQASKRKRERKFTSLEDDIKRAKDELAEATRQQRLAVPTGQGEIISPDANQARFIMGFSSAVPTVNASRPPISNPPAIIPKQQVRIEQPQQSPFNYDRIREGLARAEREKLGKDIGEQRLQRTIEANPERSARLQSEEAYRNVRQAFNLYGAPQYKRPLTGAAYKAKQDMYNRLFNQRRYDVIEAFRNRELPHKQSNKKKKTSRDDKRTVKHEDGGTLDLIRVRKFRSGGNSSMTTIVSTIPPPQESSNKSFFSNINPTIAYGLPRAIAADSIDRRMTDLAKKSVIPLQEEPFQIHRYTRSDLGAEMQGERAGAGYRLASQPPTSDGRLQTLARLQAEVLAQEAIATGKEKSNQVQRQYDELAWQQEKENAANRHETAMFNRKEQWKADQIKNGQELAYLAKKFNIWDVFGQQLEYDARKEQEENKALTDNFARSDIHNAISYAPNDYGANLTPDELAVWNKVLSGTNPSDLPLKEGTYYKLAYQKVSRAETDQLRQYHNVPNTRWAGKTMNTPWSPTISKAVYGKNGAKIAVAGIKARTADAERFQKQIKECIDRNDKAIDRLSKSLYGLIKASMIK